MENGKAELIRYHKKEVNKLPPPAALLCVSFSASLLECIRKDNATEWGLLTREMQYSVVKQIVLWDHCDRRSQGWSLRNGNNITTVSINVTKTEMIVLSRICIYWLLMSFSEIYLSRWCISHYFFSSSFCSTFSLDKSIIKKQLY